MDLTEFSLDESTRPAAATNRSSPTSDEVASVQWPSQRSNNNLMSNSSRSGPSLTEDGQGSEDWTSSGSERITTPPSLVSIDRSASLLSETLGERAGEQDRDQLPEMMNSKTTRGPDQIQTGKVAPKEAECRGGEEEQVRGG